MTDEEKREEILYLAWVNNTEFESDEPNYDLIQRNSDRIREMLGV